MASKLSATGYISSNDSKLYYETEGNPDGPTILFIHGLGGTTNAYQPIVPDLQEFNIVRFDWGGHGRSSTPKTTSIESYVADAEAVSNELKLSNVNVVGHSLGGLVALHFAAKLPDKVKALVLFGPISPPPEAGQQALKGRAAAVREKGMAGIADTVVGNAFAAESYKSKRGEVTLAREMLTRQDPEGYALACEAAANSSAPDFGKIQAKVVVVSGKEDKVSTVQAGETTTQKLGSNATQEVIDSVGHWHMLEAKEKAVEIIKATFS
ncbi:hydrolase or acyltransferase (Alpha/beta hydrolase superfamily) [Cladophialophora carrionii]|uniref:Hydrolase or acyltransferase (Alpha/beta hydrolase superfamily) n=1 Tax=Cladophialophora carrionii TaxID=86049 RepID=A0A1C1D0X0_9EURO|nr:hydrolase or acyltransferase (Alpha/beta hydrolase superfamily) [Cladophialophora carrionii]